MRAINFSDIYISGDLMKRSGLNFNRLECEEYRPDNIFKNEYSWPGDFEGRTILALVLLAQATHRQPEYLGQIMELLPSHLNEKGYFGEIPPDGFVDEQQLSGHSWFLRAMVEYYLWKKDETVLDIIQNVVKNLLLRAKGYYSKYPVHPNDRVCDGEAIGSLYKGTVGNWYLSTDVGCAFIMLDGATHAYQLLKDPELKELIDEITEKFLSIDIYGLSFQTHATLSAIRGILRYYELTGDMRLLSAVEIIFSLYLRAGMTENYANYNWFNRPEWTEPCAVMDSFILAAGLWKNTGKLNYLEVAHNIFYNAISYSQRPNGGFGCDICAGAKDEFLSPRADLFEAYWCCTMRGGEGLSRAVEDNYFTSKNEIVIPFYNDSTAHFTFDEGKIILKQTTGYPITGDVRLEVAFSDTMEEKILRLFIPSWAKKERVRLAVNNDEIPVQAVNEGFIEVKTILVAGTVIHLSFDIGIRAEPAMNEKSINGYHSFRHGVLMLGAENKGEAVRLEDTAYEAMGNACYKAQATGLVLTPINNNTYTNEKLAKESRKQVLFKASLTKAVNI